MHDIHTDAAPALLSFSSGRRIDLEAVIAGLTLDDNPGTVEGAVNRIKTINRQMYIAVSGQSAVAADTPAGSPAGAHGGCDQTGKL